MHREHCSARVSREPEPVFVALEELGRDGLLVFHSKITTPRVLADGKSLLGIGRSSLLGKGKSIVDRRDRQGNSHGECKRNQKR
jgi:hypothetical protein